MKIEKVTVGAEALEVILKAVQGPPHLIREFQVTRSIGRGPIDILIDDYNTDIKRQKEELDPEPTHIKISIALYEATTFTHPCIVCEEATTVEEIENFDPDMHYCGRSPRCCP